MGAGSSTRHTIEVFYQFTGLDKASGGVQSFNKTLGTNTQAIDTNAKSQTTLGKTARTTGTEFTKSGTQGKKMTDMFGKLDNSTQKTGGSMKRLADGMRGNRGLTFGMVGILTAGVEAVGMFGILGESMNQVSIAQERVNALVAAGEEGTREHTRALDSLNDAQRGFNFIQRNTILSFFDLVPFILLTVTALGKMDFITRNVSKAVAGLRQGLVNLGVINAATSGFDSFFRLQERGPTLIGKVDLSMKKMNTQIKGLPGVLRTAGTGFTGFFTGLSTNMGKSQGVLNKTKSVFSGFGTAIAGGLTKLGGAFKAAGIAAINFGRMVLTALLSNPITGILTAISLAVTALIFDFGGFRTKLNELGVALGNIFPPLKIILEPLGQLGEGLGWIGSQIFHMVGLGDATEEVGNKAQESANKFDPLISALETVFKISNSLDLQRVSEQINNINTELNDLGTTGTQGVARIQSNLTNLYANIKNPTAETARLTHEFRLALVEATADGVIYADEQTKLIEIYDKLKKSLSGRVEEEKQSNIIQNEAIQQTKDQEGFLDLVNLRVQQLKESKKQDNEETKNSVDLVAQWVATYGDGVELTKEMADQLKNADIWLNAFGKSLAFTEDGMVDLDKSFRLFAGQQKYLEKEASKAWEVIRAKIDGGNLSIKEAEKFVENLAKTTGVFGKEVQEKFEDYKKSIEEGGEALGELIDQTADGAEQSVQSIEDIIAAVDKLRAEEELSARIKKELTSDILADNEKLAVKIQELAIEYSKYGITSEDVFKMVQSLLQETAKETKKLEDTSKESAKAFQEAWDNAVGAVKKNISDFGSILDESKSGLAEILDKPKKDRSKDEKKRIKGLDLEGWEKDELEWGTKIEEQLNKIADNITTGRYNDAIRHLQGAMDDVPAKYQPNFDGIRDMMTKFGVHTNEVADVFGLNIDDMDQRQRSFLTTMTATFGTDPFKTYRVGIYDTNLAQAEMAAGLDELAQAAVANQGATGNTKVAWDNFLGSLSEGQKQLPVMQDLIYGVENGFIDYGDALTMATAIGQQASEQVGDLSTTLADLNTTTVDLGNGTTKTFATINGQVVELGENLDTTVNEKMTPGFNEVQNEMDNTASTAEEKLANETLTSMGILSDDSGVQMQKVVDNANMVIDIFRGLSIYATIYLINGVAAKTLDMEKIFAQSTTQMEYNGELIETAFEDVQKASSNLSTSVKTHTDSMEKNIADWQSKITSAFDKAISKAKEVTKAMQDIKKAVDAIPSTKTITIKYKTTGKPSGLQHGGSFIVDEPTQISGVNIGEFSKPELVNVIPLSNPNDINDKGINLDIDNASMKRGLLSSMNSLKQQMNKGVSNMISSGSNSGGSGSPQMVTINVMLPSGEVIAKSVQPFLLNKYSSST